MIALAYVLIFQEKNIVLLDEHNDPSIQHIYKTALNVFSFGKDKAHDLTLHTESICDAMASQFAKILKYEKDYSEESRKRLRQYSEVATHPGLQEIEFLPISPAFQNGGHTGLTRPTGTRRLYGKDRLISLDNSNVGNLVSLQSEEQLLRKQVTTYHL
jgi:DNA-binding Xre family transcriptional regulator